MVDVLYIALFLAFFGVMVLLVKACERIVGRFDADTVDGGETRPTDPSATRAPAEETAA